MVTGGTVADVCREPAHRVNHTASRHRAHCHSSRPQVNMLTKSPSSGPSLIPIRLTCPVHGDALRKWVAKGEPRICSVCENEVPRPTRRPLARRQRPQRPAKPRYKPPQRLVRVDPRRVIVK